MNNSIKAATSVTKQMEAYLLLAYEQAGDYLKVLKFSDKPTNVLAVGLEDERLRQLGAMIFTCAQAIRPYDYEITFNGDCFTVKLLMAVKGEI